ncbi:MAG TPA: hypothetical protein VI357_09075 [Mycobacteriales bacterium]
MPTFPLTDSAAAEEYLAPPSGPDLAGLEGEGWALEWAPPATAEDRPAPLQQDAPVLTQAIADAIERKDWPRVLEIALQVGWYDENRLANLLFFGRHPELNRRPLDPQHSAKDRALAEEWTRVLRTEVRPAVQRAAEDRTLEVSGALVAERDPELAGARGARFAAIVTAAAGAAGLDPGFLAAVLLAEVGSATPYLSPGEVQSFVTGTDDFLEQKKQLKANVPAFTQVRFDESRAQAFVNEHGRRVTSVPFRTGRDAALATAVYLAWAQTKLRRAMTRNGGDFDTLPMPTRFVLLRVAMAAGHGAISADGELVWHKKSAVVKAGTPGAVLLGVARSVHRVLHGEDILVRNWEPRKDPTNDSHITHRNATILAAQAAHLGDWFFRAPALGVQPELGS